MAFKLPKRGLVFWPVANGDSTTIVIDPKRFIQVDLNQLEKSEEDDEPTWSVVDELVARLPKKNSRPYLAVFVLTHPDEDHCRGFAKLFEEVDIGELWFTPRIFLEYKKDLSDSAKAFKDEAERRVKATIETEGDPGAGNRVRVFGYASLLGQDKFKGLPDDRLVVPGNALTTVDEDDVSQKFRAFAHSPFKDDIEGERNDTSLGLQITLYDGDEKLCALLLGDLKYPAVKRFFDMSKADDIAWNLLLAPHHCSKSVMYWQDDGDDEEALKQDILDAIDSVSKTPNQVVSSSNSIPSSNKKGDNPPHAKAKKRYEEITTNFVCTMENPNKENPVPVVAEFDDGQVTLVATAALSKSATDAARAAQGSDDTPGSAVTYG